MGRYYDCSLWRNSRNGNAYSLSINLYDDDYASVGFSPDCRVTLIVPETDGTTGSFSEYYTYYFGDENFDYIGDAFFNFYFNCGAENMSGSYEMPEAPEIENNNINISLHTPELGKALACEAEVRGAINYTSEYLHALNEIVKQDAPSFGIESEEFEKHIDDTVIWQNEGTFLANGKVIDEEDSDFAAIVILLVDEMSPAQMEALRIYFNRNYAMDWEVVDDSDAEAVGIEVPEGKVLITAITYYEAPFGPDEYYVPSDKVLDVAPTLSIHTPVIGETLDLTTELVGSVNGVPVTNYFADNINAAIAEMMNDIPLDMLTYLKDLLLDGGEWSAYNGETYDGITRSYGPVERNDRFRFTTFIDLGVEIPTNNPEEFYYSLLNDIGFTVNGAEMEFYSDENNDGLVWGAEPVFMSDSGPINEIVKPKGTVIAVFIDMEAGEEDLFWKPQPKPESDKHTGWFVTGPDTHAMIIGRAIITLPHELNENGVCAYCGYKEGMLD